MLFTIIANEIGWWEQNFQIFYNHLFINKLDKLDIQSFSTNMKQTKLTLLFFLTVSVQFLFSQQLAEVPDFYKTDKVQDIQITFAEDNWRYTLDSLRYNGDGFLKAKVSINGTTFDEVGVQYRGTKSFRTGSTRNPFNIRLDYYNKSNNIDGYSAIKLSNTLRDPSMVREVLGYEIARNYMPASWANYAKLTINGEYYGLMVNIESVQDDAFRKRYFGNINNTFFKANEVLGNEDVDGCKNNIYGSPQYDSAPKCYLNNFEKLSESGTKELMRLAQTLNEDTDKIEQMLDVDATLWMHAYNNVIVNLSSYSGNKSVNFYLYKRNDGRFVPIIWDLNLSFGSYKNVGNGSDIKTRQLNQLDPMLHADNPTKPLISKLLENPEYKKQYLSHLRTILYNHFVNGQYLERTRELQSMIRADFINDPNRSYEIGDFNDSIEKVVGKRSKIPGIDWLMGKRTDFLKKHPSIAISPSEVTNLSLSKREPMSVKHLDYFEVTAEIGQFPKKVTLMYQLDGQRNYKALSMSNKGDGKFTAKVTPPMGERSMDYYIIVENAGMFSYSPPNYMWEKHHASLDEINK